MKFLLRLFLIWPLRVAVGILMLPLTIAWRVTQVMLWVFAVFWIVGAFP